MDEKGESMRQRIFWTRRSVNRGDIWIDSARRAWRVVAILESVLDFSRRTPGVAVQFAAVAI